MEKKKEAGKMTDKDVLRERAREMDLGTQIFSQGPDRGPQALPHFLRAAELGKPEAQYMAAMIYYFGEGIERNLSEAVRWVGLSARNGYMDAQFELGVRYHKGEGVGQDSKKALYWYRRAAQQGHVESQINLGFMYRQEGHGIEVDYLTAYTWLLRASRSSEEADRYRKKLEPCMTREEIKKAHLSLRMN